jgi:amino acid permease
VNTIKRIKNFNRITDKNNKNVMRSSQMLIFSGTIQPKISPLHKKQKSQYAKAVKVCKIISFTTTANTRNTNKTSQITHKNGKNMHT